jgi:mono/diheme cytochrome c family protein
MRLPSSRLLPLALGATLTFATASARAEVQRDALASARGGAVVVDRAQQVAYVADADNAALHHIDLLSGAVVSTPLACAPEQVVLLEGDRVAVSLRACNRVAVLAIDAAGEGTLEAEATVAAEPWGLARGAAGEIYVVSAYGHSLSALDGETLAPRFTLDLPREPRSVTLAADGRRAFITHAVGDALSIVDLAPGAASEGPRARRLRVLGGRYRNRLDREIGAGTLHPSASLSFAAVINEAGTRLFLPHLAVQNGAETTRTVAGAYGGVPVEEDTSLPSVAVVGLHDEQLLGVPAANDKRAPQVRIAADQLSTFAVAPAGAPCRQARAASILGDSLFVTSYGTNELVEMDARSLDPAMSPRRVFAVGAGPSGVDVDPVTRIAVVWNQFSHDLSVVSLDSGAVETWPVAGDPLPAPVAAGRRLFHTEGDRRISRDGRACAACHPDGREDGLVWKLGAGPRQTPMLVGRLDHGPYGWLAKHARLEDNMRETMTRLGGSGLPAERLAELASYVREGLRAPLRPPPSEAEQARVARGKALFHEEEVGCSGCHSTELGTSDRRLHDIASRAKTDSGTSFRTPPLLFVADTAPYFHDGRYPSLEALLDDNLDRMGNTSQLSPEDRAALLTYLRTL